MHSSSVDDCDNFPVAGFKVPQKLSKRNRVAMDKEVFKKEINKETIQRIMK